MTDFAGIINIAAIALGADPISSADDDVKIARLASVRWDAARRAVLRDHPWNCVQRRSALVALTTAPKFGFAKQYPLPDGCLRVLDVDNGDAPYRIENLANQGAVLLTDAASVSVLYIADITDTSLYDAALTEALGAKLAHVLAFAITGSQAAVDSTLKLYKDALAGARSVDAQESGPETLEANGWILSRWGDADDFRPIASGS
jgi:hypothetical protein